MPMGVRSAFSPCRPPRGHGVMIRSAHVGPKPIHGGPADSAPMKSLYCAPFMRVSNLAGLVWVVLMGQSLAQAQAQTPTPAPTSPVATSAMAPVAAPTPTFAVLEFAVEGNTVLPQLTIEKVLAPYMGPGKTIGDMEAARNALEKVYQEGGYLTVFVDLPEQSTADGVIRLSVLEGKVERLSVKGSRYYSQGFIRNRVPELAEGKVPNFLVVQGQLADVNRTDDRRVQPVLRQGHALGGVEADLKVSDEMPLHGNFELNNNHCQYTPPWRVMTSLRYENAFQSDHTVNFMAITAPQEPKVSTALLLDYIVPLKGGDAWRVTGLYSNSNVDALGAATILGKGYSLGVKRVWSLPNRTGLAHTFTAGWDFKDFKESTVAGADSLYTPIRYAPFNLAYDGQLNGDDGSTTTLTLTSVMGLRQLFQRNHDCGFGSDDQFACKRSGADGGFAYFKFDAHHGMPVQGWRVESHLTGQVATQALLGAEQFALTGADVVRGYLAAEAVGDHGVMGALELHSPNLIHAGEAARLSWYDLNDARAFGFVDGGRVWTLDTSAGQAKRQTALSWGLGAELKTLRHSSLIATWAVPLKASTVTRIHHPHLHMALSLDF
jgi:hemolysin activation/secretion protein